MKLSVIGTGYLGATHAACMAELGFEVIGVDVDAEVSRFGDPVPPMFWLRDLEANIVLVVEGPELG